MKTSNLSKVLVELKEVLAKYEKYEVVMCENHIRIYSNCNVLFATPSLLDVMDVLDKHNRVICIIDNYAQIH